METTIYHCTIPLPNLYIWRKYKGNQSDCFKQTLHGAEWCNRIHFLPQKESINKSIQIFSLQNIIYGMSCDANTVISNPSLREVIGADPLWSVPTANLLNTCK